MTPDERAAALTLAAQLQQAGQMAVLGLQAAQTALQMAEKLLTTYVTALETLHEER